jgi:general secretion pathway protein D
MKFPKVFLLILGLGLAACATISPLYHQGVRAEMSQQWEEAIAAYQKAALENPKQPIYRAALERARFGASLFYLQQARLLVAQDKREEAKAAYAKAMEYNPRDVMIAHEAQKALAAGPKEPGRKPSKIEFPIKLKPKDEPLQLRFATEVSLRSIFQALGRAGGVNIVFDENFRDVPFTLDASNQSFEQALKSACLATRHFYKIVDEKTVMVIPDQPLKRMQYETNCIKTFYLSNVTAQELVASLSQALRTQVKAPTIIFDKGLNSLTIRGTPQEVELSERLIIAWDKPKGEVMIKVEIMEVSRMRLRQLGLSFDQNLVGLRYGTPPTDSSAAAASTTGWFPLQGLGLGKSENYSISLPVAYLQFLESDTDTKVIAQPWLRGVSDEEIRQLVGQKIPIPRTTFQPFAAGGFAQQPIMNYEQQDVGIEVKLTPKIHLEREVTLTTEFKVTSVGGKGIGDIPILNTRELKGVMRLREGETQLVAGLLREEERKSFKGIPGLKNIPGLGRLFGSEDTTVEQTDILIALTPYIIRTIPIGEEDDKPFWVDIETGGTDRAVAFDQELLDRELDVEARQRVLDQGRAQDQGANTLRLIPQNFELPVGREIRVNLQLMNTAEIGTISVTVNFAPQILTLKDVAEGNLSRQLGGNVPFLKSIDNNAGMCVIGFSSPQIGKGVRGGGTLATLIFEAKAAGECLVSVAGVQAAGGSGQNVVVQTPEGRSRIIVRPGS